MADAQIPLQLPQFTKADYEEEGMPNVAQFHAALVNKVNLLAGHAGDVPLAGSLDLQGQTIKNVKPGTGPGEVVTKGQADENYGAAAIAPQLESSGKYPLKTVRRLNDTTQREGNSTFLNSLMNTTPTANDATLSYTGVSGGVCTVTVSAGHHIKLDGSVEAFAARTDTIAVPSSIALTSLVRASGVVTATSASPHGLTVGESVSVVSASDVTFIGNFAVVSVPDSTHFTFQQTGPDDPSGLSGTASVGGVYYYNLANGENVLTLDGPYSADTWANRANSNNDGRVQIAVIVINSSGFSATQSSAGGTSPAATNGVRIFGRL